MHLVLRNHRSGLHQLVAVAHVEFEAVLDLVSRDALPDQILRAQFLQFCNDAVEARVVIEYVARVRVVQHHVQRLLVDVQLVHVACPHRREHRAERRREDLVDAQVAGDAAAVQRPVAAARSLARSRSISLGAAVSELARRGLSGGPDGRTGRPTVDLTYSPFPILIGDGDVVTDDLVAQWRDA